MDDFTADAVVSQILLLDAQDSTKVRVVLSRPKARALFRCDATKTVRLDQPPAELTQLSKRPIGLRVVDKIKLFKSTEGYM